jgi:hypothetical protein
MKKQAAKEPAPKVVKPSPNPRAVVRETKASNFDTGRTEGVCYTHQRTRGQA